MSAALYQQIFSEVRKHLPEEDADILADSLAYMHPDRVRALFKVIDEYEPGEAEQGLVPIPDGYAEQ